MKGEPTQEEESGEFDEMVFKHLITLYTIYSLLMFRKKNQVSLMKCDEPFDNCLHSKLTLYVPVAETIKNDLAEAEVAPEEEVAAPEDVEEDDIVQAVVEAEVALEAEANTPDDAADECIIEESTIEDSALESTGDLIPLAEDDNLDIGDADVIDAEVAPEAEADMPEDTVDVALIEDAALESAEDLIPLVEDDDVEVHHLVEAEEEYRQTLKNATDAEVDAEPIR